MPSFSAAHRPEQLVAAGLGLELLLLVEGELFLEAFLALVESGHVFEFPSALNGAVGPTL